LLSHIARRLELGLSMEGPVRFLRELRWCVAHEDLARLGRR
jgi:hypothetical protein